MTVRRVFPFTFVGIAALFAISLATPTVLSQTQSQTYQDCASLDTAKGLRLATGPSDGAYYKLGVALFDLAAKEKLPLQLCNTQGSVENIRVVSDRQADLAVVQADAMLDAWSHAEQPETKNGSQNQEKLLRPETIFLVRFLYSERLHILVGPDTGIYSLGNLKGKTIWIGPVGSGSRNMAMDVLHAAGFSEDEIQKMAYCSDEPRCTPTQGLKDLARGKVSALFRTTAIPKEKIGRAGISNLAESVSSNTPAEEIERRKQCITDWGESSIASTMCIYPEVRLLGLDPSFLASLSQNPSYINSLIPRNLYPNQNYSIATLGVKAMLVTNMASTDDRVSAIYRLLNNKENLIPDRELDLLNGKVDDESKATLGRHIHNKVISELVPSKWRVFFRRLALLGAAFLVLWWFLRPDSHRDTQATRFRVATCVVVLLVLWFALGTLLYLTESQYSAEYDNPWEASWSVLGHFAQGLQTPTMTPRGREIAFFGLALLILFTGWLRTALVDGSIDRLATLFSKGLPARRRIRTRSRQIVLNWQGRDEERLKALIRGDAKESSVLIVAPRKPIDPPTTQGLAIEFLEGDPRSREVLEKAHVRAAESVTILASWLPDDPNDRRRNLDSDVADSFTIMTILAIRTLCQLERSSRWVPITAELLSSQNTDAALRAGQRNIRVVHA